MKIGLLDFGIRTENVNSIQIIEDLLEYAIKAEEFGYNRIWLSEHHNFNPVSPWLSPEVIIPIIAGITSKIKVGSGGILLRHHSPYRIAYSFKLLNNLFSDRIDLGIAKGFTSKNLSYGSNEFNDIKISDFEEKLRNLVSLLKDEDYHFKKEVVIPPYKGNIPDMWYLTGSYNNLDQVLDLGLNLSRSFFHPGSDINYNKDILESFKDSFYNQHKKYPKISIAFSGCCSKNEKSARATFEGYSYGIIPDNIVGSPSLFEDKLNEFEYQYGINEFIFMNVALKSKDRIKSIELLSRKLKLS